MDLPKVKCMLILLSMILFAQAEMTTTETPNPGPRSSAEAQFLDEEGSKAFTEAKYELAQKDFERLIERYPSSANALAAYPKLIVIYSSFRHDHPKTIQTIQKYLLLNPKAKDALDMKALLASSYLGSGKITEARITSEEILKSKDASENLKATALLLKTDSLSRQKKFKEANASFDALESQLEKVSDPKTSEKLKQGLPALKLTLNTRECSAMTLPAKKKGKAHSDNVYLEYFNQKDTCLKSALSPGVQSIPQDDSSSLRLWCEVHEALTRELNQEKMDSFLKQKISKPLAETEGFAKSLNPELVHCL